jgi:hypothetical protein
MISHISGNFQKKRYAIGISKIAAQDTWFSPKISADEAKWSDLHDHLRQSILQGMRTIYRSLAPDPIGSVNCVNSINCFCLQSALTRLQATGHLAVHHMPHAACHPALDLPFHNRYELASPQ